MPRRFSSRRRACFQASSRRVLNARVDPRTAAAYNRRVNQCRDLCVVGAVSGRSLRAEGATDLFAVGATNQFVKHQGGWLGYSFVRYDRPTPATRVFLANKYSRRLRSLLSAYTQ